MAIHAANTSSSSSNHDGTGGGSPSGGSSSRQEKDGNNGQKGNDIGNDKPNEVDMDIVKKQELQMKYEELRDLVTQFFREMLNAETEESFSGFYHEWSFYVRQLAEVESQLGISNFVQDISQKGVEFIADYEQLKTEVYDDACGNPTIGYGHLIKPDENFDNGITKEEALQLLKQDLQIAVKAVRDNITVPLTQQQFDALVSLAFNIGADAFGKSSLAKAINNNDTSKIESRMKAWNKGTVDGKLVVLDGLVARRNDEYEMFSKGDYARDYDYNR